MEEEMSNPQVRQFITDISKAAERINKHYLRENQVQYSFQHSLVYITNIHPSNTNYQTSIDYQ